MVCMALLVHAYPCVCVCFFWLSSYLDKLVLRPFLPIVVCAVFFACCVRRIIHRSSCSKSISFIIWRSRKSGLSSRKFVTCSGDRSNDDTKQNLMHQQLVGHFFVGRFGLFCYVQWNYGMCIWWWTFMCFRVCVCVRLKIGWIKEIICKMQNLLELVLIYDLFVSYTVLPLLWYVPEKEEKEEVK